MINKLKFFFMRNWKYIVVGIVCCLPILFFIINFSGQSISNDSTDWGTFGDYISGTYSVVIALLIVYITKQVNRKEEINRKRMSAVELIYSQLAKIDSNHIDIRSANKLTRDILGAKLFLPESLFGNLIQFTDYLKEVKDDIDKQDLRYEASVNDLLKNYYDTIS